MSAIFAPRDSRTTRLVPQIKAVVPVVRLALLKRHEPRLTKDRTQRAYVAFAEAWPEWNETYRHAVAERAHVQPGAVAIHPTEHVRLRIDGKTPMIDVPSLSVADNFDLRNCAALCVDEFSSKFWTRVGPQGFAQSFSGRELTRLLARYRALAYACGDWFYDEMVRIAGDSLTASTLHDEGRLEVTTIGLQLHEELTEDEVDAWFFDGERPNFENEDLCAFFKQAARIDYDLAEVERREGNAFWMSMPMAVRLRNGTLAERTALYLVRPLERLVQVVGVGLDDSEAGDFANEVALKVSRVVANRV